MEGKGSRKVRRYGKDEEREIKKDKGRRIDRRERKSRILF